ncbi:MAG: XRE family transcriptional regulator [Thalassobaculaceae bacterium]|nr:XRE family transcriptional regulator [Thalassobaculaceae bacterium]
MPVAPNKKPRKSAPAQIDRPNVQIGRQIRDLRRSRGLTLSALGRIVGRSVGHLSELERGGGRIRLDVLDSISRALDVSISYFFSAPDPKESPESEIVVRKAHRREINLRQSGVHEQLLSPHLAGQLEMVLTTFSPGSGTGDGGRQRKGDEGGLVLSGVLELKVDDHGPIVLEAGDSFQLTGNGRHWCHNPGPGDAVIVWSFSHGNF